MFNLLKLAIICFIFGLFIGSLSARPQQITLPDVSFTTKDLIDIMADYNIRHYTQENVPIGADFYGLTDSDTKTIWINDTAALGTKRQTVIHEVLHALYWNMGVSTYDIGPENMDMAQAIRDKAKELVKQIYGPVILEKKDDAKAIIDGGFLTVPWFPFSGTCHFEPTTGLTTCW